MPNFNTAPQQHEVKLFERIDFEAINRSALSVFPSLLERWLPNGRAEGKEYVALNPRRADRNLGSFRINTRNGKWADFAVKGASGGDVISLTAYLFNLTQVEAARKLAAMMGIRAYE